MMMMYLKVVGVSPEVGFVHHYRDCTSDYEYDLSCNVATFVPDNTLHKAGHIPTLTKRVRTRLNALRRTDAGHVTTASQHLTDH